MTSVSSAALPADPTPASSVSSAQRTKSESDEFAHIDTASRLQSLTKSQKLQQTLEEQREGESNDAASRWRRAGVLTGRLGQQDCAPAPAVKGDSKAKSSKPTSPSQPLGSQAPTKVDSLTDQLHSTTLFDKIPFRFKNEAEEKEFIKESKALTKRMEEQNWLEMLDPKHRYGSNLKHYHRYWSNKAETSQNFLQWLDEGDGKDLSLEECSREKLEGEQIAYLTVDQRKNYMTYIDNETLPNGDKDHSGPGRHPSFSFRLGEEGGKGRLRWCRTGELVTTSKYDHGDLGKGKGVALRESQEWQSTIVAGDACDVLRDDKIKVKRRNSSSSTDSFTSYEEHSDDSSQVNPKKESLPDCPSPQTDEKDELPSPERSETTGPKIKRDLDEKQQTLKETLLEKANLGPKYLIKKKLGMYPTSERQQIIQGDPETGPAGETSHPDALVRKRKADTWIFVTDLSYNIYIGIKQRGRFQHSSLLAGSLVTVAGVLKVKDGVIVSIYPWSGHYRSSSEHFEEFIKRLQQRGLDTSKINVTKSKWVIEVVNRYGMYRKKKDRKIKDFKDKVHETWDQHSKPTDSTADKSSKNS